MWSIVNPLSQLLIYTYVFSVVLKVKLSLKGLPANENVSFGLWLFAGLLPWIAFSTGLVQSAGSVIGQPNLVKKVVFPLSLLPLVPIFSAFIESSFGLIMLIFFVALSFGYLTYYTGIITFSLATAVTTYRWFRLFSGGINRIFTGYSTDVKCYS